MSDIRLLVVESDKSFLMRLEQILESTHDIRMIGRADTSRVARRLIKEYPYDALLVDLDLPDGGGLNLIRLSKELNAQTPIQVITSSSDDPYVISAIETGANGYLLKHFDTEAVLDNIRLAVAGGAAVSAEVARNVIRSFGKLVNEELHEFDQACLPEISQRESEILSLLSQGLNNETIATVLAISPHTVLAHLKKIYKKLGVHSRAQAVTQARAYLKVSGRTPNHPSLP